MEVKTLETVRNVGDMATELHKTLSKIIKDYNEGNVTPANGGGKGINAHKNAKRGSSLVTKEFLNEKKALNVGRTLIY